MSAVRSDRKWVLFFFFFFFFFFFLLCISPSSWSNTQQWAVPSGWFPSKTRRTKKGKRIKQKCVTPWCRRETRRVTLLLLLLLVFFFSSLMFFSPFYYHYSAALASSPNPSVRRPLISFKKKKKHTQCCSALPTLLAHFHRLSLGFSGFSFHLAWISSSWNKRGHYKQQQPRRRIAYIPGTRAKFHHSTDSNADSFLHTFAPVANTARSRSNIVLSSSLSSLLFKQKKNGNGV